jgi:hypothetical protein
MKSLTQTIQSQCVIADNGPTYWCRAQEILSSWLWREKRNRSERSRSRSRSTLTYPTMADLLPHRNKNGGEKARGLPPPRHGTPWRSDAVVASGSARARGKLSVRTERRARTHPSLAAAELRLPPCRAEWRLAGRSTLAQQPCTGVSGARTTFRGCCWRLPLAAARLAAHYYWLQNVHTIPTSLFIRMNGVVNFFGVVRMPQSTTCNLGVDGRRRRR